jgi:hypothetical protein
MQKGIIGMIKKENRFWVIRFLNPFPFLKIQLLVQWITADPAEVEYGYCNGLMKAGEICAEKHL